MAKKSDDKVAKAPTSVDEHGVHIAVQQPTTIDDHGTDRTVKTPAASPTTVDDHGGQKGKSGSDSDPTHH